MRAPRSRSGWGTAVLALVVLTGAGCAPAAEEPLRHGGRLVVALRAEPGTLNPTTSARLNDHEVIGRLHESLVVIDRETLEPVPALAESWRVSEDGRVIDLALRRGVRFSDGEAFDSEDVVSTFETLLDPAVGSPLRSTFVVGDVPVRVTATGTHGVRFEMGGPRAGAVRLLDGVAILPSHRVRSLVESGEWAGAWGVTTPPEEIAGLGPFQLARHQPGERMVLGRNPHYWKRAADGSRLPHLDEIEFLFVPDEDAEVVRFAAGDTDMIDHLSPESFLVLKRAGDDRVLTDVGPSLSYSILAFNLNDLHGRGLDEVASRQTWFRERRFRRAVSLAIDRTALVNVVYRGRATPLATHQSPSIVAWSNPDLEPHRQDVDAARRQLRDGGFDWRGGALVGPEGREVRFSVLVNAANTTRRRIATLLQRDLEALGIGLDVVPFDQGSLIQRVVQTYDYEAVLLALGPQDPDPGAHAPTLVTGGRTHVWRMGDSPATDWERELDRVMREQAITLDPSARRTLYWRAQEIVATELPFVPLLSPNVLVGWRAGLGGVRPTVVGSHLLWNADELYWEAGAS